MLTFDHLVHFVKDPNEAIKNLKEHGIHGVQGGAHVNLGTHNTLSYFDLSYIEFLGLSDRKLFEQSEHPKHSLTESIINDQFVEGFSRFAARTTDIEGVARHFRENGLDVNGPVPLKRKRPDGSVISWQLLFVGDETDELQLPFIIQWDDDDEKRRLDQVERGIITPHQAGVSFSHVTFAVKDAERTAAKWAKLLKLDIGRKYVDPSLHATCQVLELAGGDLVFASPDGAGVVANILKERGERPFRVTLSSGTNDHSFELLGATYQLTKS